MRTIAVLWVFLTLCGQGWAADMTDASGVIRVFGDASNWMSACFVVGDGSWVVTTADTITEKAGPDTERTIRYPIFISYYTGRAYQCELKAHDKDLNVALLKLPMKGLPATPLAPIDKFKKAAYGTLGQLVSGEPMGNRWPTGIYGITREKKNDTFQLVIAEWNAAKVFVTDIGDYKWVFVSDVTPDKPVPNGSMVMKDDSVVGMYLNKLTITGTGNDVVFGRCAMSTEITKYLGKYGVDASTLSNPPAATVKRDPNAREAFQLQATVYSLIGAGRTDLAVEMVEALVKAQPDDAQNRMVLGLALTANGKFEEAISSFDEAAKLDPNLPSLRMNRALALVGLKKRDEAEAELLKAISEATLDPRPVAALAEFYLGDEKQLDQALTYAKNAQTMSPNSPAALLLVAKVLKEQKKYQDAIDKIGEAVKMAPDWGSAWYALGATYEAAGDKTNAERAYKTLVEKQPKNPDSLLTYASFLADQGKKDEAKEYIAKIRELKPPQPILDAVQKLEEKIEGKEPGDGSGGS